MAQTRPALDYSGFACGRFRFNLRFDRRPDIRGFLGHKLRGALGSQLLGTSCPIEADTECRLCPLAPQCAFSYLFATQQDSRPASYSRTDVTRPFAIEPPAQPSGDRLGFGLTLLGAGIGYLPHFVAAFRRLRFGGADCWLESVEDLLAPHSPTVFSRGRFTAPITRLGWNEVSTAGPESCDRLTIRFLTPVRLVRWNHLVESVDFETLVRALLRRAGEVMERHCGVSPVCDYSALLTSAQSVATVESRLRPVSVFGYSRHQQRVRRYDGLGGSITFSGPALGQFLPLVRLGELIHVGKSVTAGFGWYAVAIL